MRANEKMLCWRDVVREAGNGHFQILRPHRAHDHVPFGGAGRPVLPTGLTADGVKVVQSALRYGVRLTAEGGNLQKMDEQVGQILERVREVVNQLQRKEREDLRAELERSPLGRILSSALQPEEEVPVVPDASYYTRPTVDPAAVVTSHKEFWTGARRLPSSPRTPNLRCPLSGEPAIRSGM